MSFKSELTALINKYSMESGSDTPDFILAEFISSSITAFELAVLMRESWYGRVGSPNPWPKEAQNETQTTQE